MKFSAALSLALAPLALAKAVNNVYPVRRMEAKKGAAKGAAAGAVGGGAAVAVGLAAGGAAVINPGAVTQVIIIWQNPGGGAATTTVNQQMTVTQTVTASAPGAPVASGAPPPAAPPGAATTHSVVVGGAAGLVYTPSEVKAKVGDMVVFTFMNANHSTTQSTFDKPCDPMPGGMDSGFQPNPNNTVNPPPQVAMQVMVETPLWFYCKQTTHCGKGMTFSINPTAEKSQALFQSMAIAQKGTGTPSAIVGGKPGAGAPAAGAGNGTAAAPPAAAPPAAAPPAKEGGGAGKEGGAANGAAQGAGNMVPGVGQLQAGQCVCAVTCAPGSFPAVAVQGIGAFGGVPGGMPAEMAEA